MADENTETKVSPAPAAGDAAKATPPAGGAGGASGDAGAKADGAKPDLPKADAGSPNVVTIGDDDYPVDADGYLKISVQTFKRRMGRYSKVQLREAFGTDDVDDIKARLGEHAKLKAKAEDDHKKTLAKEEALALERDKEKTRADRAEARAAQLAEEREFHEADSEVRAAAEKHVKPGKLSKLAVYEFGEHVRDLDDDEAAKLTKRDVDKWFADWAKENPDYARTAKDDKDKKDDKGVRKPMEHGAGDAGAAPKAADSPGGKTARPGQANSMSDDEYRQFKRSQGLS